MRSAGVVADHATQRAAAVRAGIGSIRQSMLFRCIAQGVANNARFHAGELLDRIYLQNPIQMFRYVDHNGNVHTLTAHRGAAAAWQYGRVELAAYTDRLD